MSYETLLVKTENGVGHITLNRPKVLNALNDQVITELGAVMGKFKADPEVKVLVITGSGEKAFAAGADIGELAAAAGIEALDLARKGQRLTRDMEQLGKPIVAAINGFALGGGCELAMACTLRIAADNAVFGQPEVNLGIIPGYGGTQRLSRLIGKGRAMDLVLTGRNVEAEEALAIGLVNRVVPIKDLEEETAKVAKKLMQKGPIALRLCMEAVNRGFDMTLDDGLELEANLFGVCSGTEDTTEGLAAFLEKRRPEFKGK